MSLTIVAKGKTLRDYKVALALIDYMGQMTEHTWEEVSPMVFNNEHKQRQTILVETYMVQAIHQAAIIQGEAWDDLEYLEDNRTTSIKRFWENASVTDRAEVCRRALDIIMAEYDDLAYRFDDAMRKWRMRPEDPDPTAQDKDDIPF